ncbi:hypothetical protein F4859DRAFT_524391 [Xylaria cf. heliscus]|nr:hypothetical protein F4859DRAFT_524391 [Xylaria cf. heliscus]
MHREIYDDQLTSYVGYNTIPEAADHCATQLMIGSFDLISEELSNTSSPASQATAPSEIVLTPGSELDQFPLGANYSPFLCQQQQELILAAPVFEDPFFTADPSLSFQPQEVDSSTVIDSPNWHSVGPHQFTWYPSGNEEPDMMAQFNEQLPRQMPSEICGDSVLEFKQETEAESSSESSSLTISSPSEKSPTLAKPGELAQEDADIEDLFRFDNGDIPTVPTMAGMPGTNRAKPEEPYAKLIQRALMSANEHKMALQQIYQWFRDNTDKTNNDGKGWQNSIRHNLSMNAAFVKCERNSGSAGTADPKKSTVWELAPWAIRDGVQSTTRYRKGAPARRTGSAAHNRSNGNIPLRASSSRRGGVNTSKNRPVDVRRSVLTRAAHMDSLQRQIDPAITGPANNQLFSYNYHPNANPTMNHFNWMDLQNQMPQTPSDEFAMYSYNHPYHIDAINGFSQGEHSQTLFPEEFTGAYDGSPLSANMHMHNQELTLSPHYNVVFPNPQDPLSNYFTTWNPTHGAGPYP